MEHTDIQVEGSHNRVAGRDYWEVHPTLNITPEQLQQLALAPCPECEVRLITAGRSRCNHCQHRHEVSRRINSLTIWVALVLLLWLLLIDWQQKYSWAGESASGPIFLALSVATVVFARLTWVTLRTRL